MYVAPPYLHILLGIVLKHHKLLEQAVDGIDSSLFETLKDKQTNNSIINNFKKFGKNWRQATDYNEQITSLVSRIENCIEEDKVSLVVMLKTVRRSLEQLKFEHLCARSGPVCFSLDAVLTKHKITPQFYHSRAFIGNHCHKYLTCRIYEVLTTEVIK